MSLVGAGVIGARGVGATHVAALRSIGGVDVRWIAGSRGSTTGELARRLGVPRWTTSYHEVINNRDVDVVHVCAPNHLHADIAAAALRAGKHVVCEKPLTSTPEAAAELQRVSESSAGLSAACYGYRFLPLLRRLRAMVSAGDVGPVHAVRGSYLQNWRLDAVRDWRSEPHQMGRSRVLADIGSHVLDIAETVVGETVSLHGALFTSVGRSAAAAQDEDVSLHGRLSNGAALSVHLSQVAAMHTNTLTLAVDGATGAAEWSFDGVEHLRVASATDVARLAVDRHSPTSSSSRCWTNQVSTGHGLRQLLTSFYRTLSGAVPELTYPVPLPTFGDGARHVRLIDRAAEGLPVEPDPPAAATTAS